MLAWYVCDWRREIAPVMQRAGDMRAAAAATNDTGRDCRRQGLSHHSQDRLREDGNRRANRSRDGPHPSSLPTTFPTAIASPGAGTATADVSRLSSASTHALGMITTQIFDIRKKKPEKQR